MNNLIYWCVKIMITNNIFNKSTKIFKNYLKIFEIMKIYLIKRKKNYWRSKTKTNNSRNKIKILKIIVKIKKIKIIFYNRNYKNWNQNMIY